MRLNLKRNYFVPAIVWSIIAGESGTKKSPALAVAVQRIKDHEHREFQEHIDRMATAEDPKTVPSRIRFCVGDTTTEALVPILAENERGLLVERDELSGFFASMDRYSGSRKVSADAAAWLSMYNASSLSVDRKMDRQATYIRSAFINITGGIQPSILHKVLAGEHTENGMASRFLCAYRTSG